ncbi:MAG: hypothetical protein IJH81_05435 [Lachnospiraceae bacterium]|nr:hypothetical protein [Lachnospiraceae bacterium]
MNINETVPAVYPADFPCAADALISFLSICCIVPLYRFRKKILITELRIRIVIMISGSGSGICLLCCRFAFFESLFFGSLPFERIVSWKCTAAAAGGCRKGNH